MKLSFGTNDLLASSSFNERQSYIENYSTGLADHSFVNYWYDHMLFGRINENQDAIYLPDSAPTKRILGENEVFALNFVSDAFVSLKLDIETKILNGSLGSRGFLSGGFEAKRGWRSPRAGFFLYMQSLYDDIILPYMADPSVNSKISGFQDFVEHFSALVDRMTLLRPFTMSEYVLSNFSSPLYTGLAVEIDDESDHGDDLEKILKYNNDDHFEVYRQAAANHGFNVDKNAPWRLVAITYSPPMQGKMAAYGLTDENLVENVYKDGTSRDVEDLKFYMREFYNNFVTQFPNISLPSPSAKKTLTQTLARDKMSQEEFNEEWASDDNFWSKLYIYIRAKETNRGWDQNKFKTVAEKAAQFLKYSNQDAAYKYINKEVRRPWGEYVNPPKYRRGSFRF